MTVPGLSVYILTTAYPPAGTAIVSLYGAPESMMSGTFPSSHVRSHHVTSSHDESRDTQQ